MTLKMSPRSDVWRADAAEKNEKSAANFLAGSKRGVNAGQG